VLSDDLPETEAVDERSTDLDALSSDALVTLLIEAQRGAVEAVFARRHEIAGVVDEIVRRLEDGGRLHYVGAGTSGRLAMLDAAEMPPTFGVEPGLVRAHLAGGASALVRAVEGAEDDARAGEEAVRDVDAGDVVIGLSAAGGASFVIAAVTAAGARGAFTVAIVNTDRSALAAAAQRAIVLHTGAEPVAGSTRMRAGTAQKVVLNAISTAAMVLLGRVYGNLMVDVVASNRKLSERARRLVCRIAGVDEARAATLLAACDGSVKVAVVMARHGVDAATARRTLERARGRLREAL